MLLYLRKVRLTASGTGGTLLINHHPGTGKDLKIEFDVSKGISSNENAATIKIYNLEKGHAMALGKELDEITLEAGYSPPDGGDNVGIIFKGQIRDVEHRRSGADRVTFLWSGEGDKALRKATISKTYKAGTEVKEVVEDINKELEKEGISRGEQKVPDAKFKRPYAAVGSARSQFDLLSRGYNFHWNIQNGVCEVLPADETIGTELVFGPESGLVGSPTITDNGIKATFLLNPEVRVNRPVTIRSEVLEMNKKDARYRVSELNFSGDNMSGDFYVSIVGEELKEGKVDEGKVENLKNQTSPNIAQEYATSGLRGDQ